MPVHALHLDDLKIGNDVSKRTVKVLAIVRKAYLFVGSRGGGNWTAILFSSIASAKANQQTSLT